MTSCWTCPELPSESLGVAPAVCAGTAAVAMLVHRTLAGALALDGVPRTGLGGNLFSGLPPIGLPVYPADAREFRAGPRCGRDISYGDL